MKTVTFRARSNDVVRWLSSTAQVLGRVAWFAINDSTTPVINPGTLYYH